MFLFWALLVGKPYIHSILYLHDMSVIRVSKSTKMELLRYASELQIRLGRRVDFDEAIAWLLREARRRRPELLLRACSPIEGAEGVLGELYEERRRDEERAKRKYGV